MVNSLSDQEVQELIKITEGCLKEKRGHWYTLGIPIETHYSLNEQLDAVRKLSLSGNRVALNYLSRLNLNEQVDNGCNTSWDGYGDTCYDTVYPNAEGELKDVLESRMVGGYTSPAKYQNHPRQEETREILHESLSKLEASLRS